MSVAVRRGGAIAGLLVLAGSALYSGDHLGLRTRLIGNDVPPPRPAAVGRAADAVPTAAPATQVRSSPWWQQLVVDRGGGDARIQANLDVGALQWRVHWSCTSGALELTDAAAGSTLVTASCPDQGTAYATTTGPRTLELLADDGWELRVEQQLDVPLVEPPLPDLSAPSTIELASGTFHDVDRTGRGQASVYRLADGRHVLRLEEFFVSPNTDLEVRFSTHPDPRTTQDHVDSQSVLVARLDATAGAMNLIVPDEIDVDAYRSIVIWCPPLDSAYAAARLDPRGTP